jgi:cobalt-zinc-cadmium efflux system outer membrane protein
VRFTHLLPALLLSGIVFRSVGTGVSAQAAGQTGRAAVEWTFDDVVKATLAQHPLIDAARERVAAARGARQTAASFSNPVATYWMENGSFPGQSLIGHDRETSAYVTLPLEPLFQRNPRIRHADADVDVAELALRTARRQVVVEATRAFYRLALAQATLDAIEENRSGLERLVSYNRSRVTEGATAEIELIRVQVELDRAATNIALAEVDLVRSRADLLPFLGPAASGADLRTLHVVLPAISARRLAFGLLDTFAARAQERRPEVLIARARVSAATADIAVQRALTVRQLGATFGVKRIAGENTMVAGLSVPMPLFDQNRGEVQRATAELTAAQHELAWAERTVTTEVEGAYAAAQRLVAQVSPPEPSFLDRAAEANRITVGAYQEGGATLLQVLDASRSLTEARLTYSRAALAQHQSLFDLAIVAGDDPEAALNALVDWYAPPNAGRLLGTSQ